MRKEFQPSLMVSHELCSLYHVDVPLKMPYDHARRRYELVTFLVHIAEKFNLQLRCSKNYKCCKLDTVSSIYFLTYRCNIVQEVALTITCIRVNIVIFVFVRHYATSVDSKLVLFFMLVFTCFGVRNFVAC